MPRVGSRPQGELGGGSEIPGPTALADDDGGGVEPPAEVVGGAEVAGAEVVGGAEVGGGDCVG
jgi:hypothetical protein